MATSPPNLEPLPHDVATPFPRNGNLTWPWQTAYQTVGVTGRLGKQGTECTCFSYETGRGFISDINWFIYSFIYTEACWALKC